MGFLTNAVFVLSLVLIRDMCLNGTFSDAVFTLLVSIHGMYSYAETHLKLYNEELYIVEKILETCETVTTSSGGKNAIAIGFRYINEECTMLGARRYELNQKCFRLDHWTYHLTPKEQYQQINKIK